MRLTFRQDEGPGVAYSLGKLSTGTFSAIPGALPHCNCLEDMWDPWPFVACLPLPFEGSSDGVVLTYSDGDSTFCGQVSRDAVITIQCGSGEVCTWFIKVAEDHILNPRLPFVIREQ